MKTYERFLNENKYSHSLIKTYENFVNENVQNRRIKRKIRNLYNKQIKTKISKKDIEVEIIDGVYVVWIPKHVFQEMGKRGFSENDAENNRLVISKHLKDEDPGCMLEHELGHIYCYKNHKEYWKNEDPIIEDPNIIQKYPNVKDEYYPFFNQYKALKKKYIDRDKILEKFLYDYKQSGKVSENELKEYEKFFDKLIDVFENKNR